MGCAGASCWNQRKFGARSGGRTRIPFRMRELGRLPEPPKRTASRLPPNRTCNFHSIRLSSRWMTTIIGVCRQDPTASRRRTFQHGSHRDNCGKPAAVFD